MANFHPSTIKDSPNTRIRIRMVNNRPTVASVNGVDANSPELKGRFEISDKRNVLEYGEPDFLFINDGSGNFSKTDYLKRFLDENGNELEALPLGWGLAARFTDVNRDVFQDLYVCNDLFTPDRFWINDGTGRFKAIASWPSVIHPRFRWEWISVTSIGMGLGFLRGRYVKSRPRYAASAGF